MQEAHFFQGQELPKPPAIYLAQIVFIHNLDANQCHRIRQGLIKTGLISFAGPVFINLSPFTAQTIDSLPSDAFKEADYHMECLAFDQAVREGKTKRPMLFQF